MTTTTQPKQLWIGDDNADDLEHFRLRALEGTLDPHTIRLLRDEIGVRPGWRCLEVGAGAGSIARWLSDRVGLSGEVVALDMNTRFLHDLRDNVTVVEHKLGDPLPDLGSFDLIHHRAVLQYVPERLEVLASLSGLLRPKGWLLSEEQIFPSTGASAVLAGTAVDMADAAALYQGVLDLLVSSGTDMTFGGALPRLFREHGLIDVLHEGFTLVTPGDEGPVGDVAWPIVKGLAARFEAELGFTPERLERCIEAFRRSTTWWQIPVFFSTWGRKS